MLTGENGILTQARNAKEETSIAEEKEQIALAYNGAATKKQSTDITDKELDDELKANDVKATAEGENPIVVTFEESQRKYEIDSNGNIEEVGGDEETPTPPATEGTLGTVTGTETSNTTVQDSLENKVVVPAGFKVVNPEDNVEDGIIIEDVNHEATKGSQFVWIPVGKIHRKDKEDVTITLSRYTFADNGTPTDQGSKAIDSYGYNHQEINTGKGNTTAKENIESAEEGFRGSAIKNGGYYIGRYEARTATERIAETDSLTQITVKPDEYVYNYVTQLQAASLSQGMYNDSNFESDLVNSYAWDTAIVFIQECSGDTDYSRQTSLNESLSTTGTTNDNPCNIYDMASNCYEWTTETSSAPNSPCVFRGGSYLRSYSYTATRSYSSTSDSYSTTAFRPLLYL